MKKLVLAAALAVALAGAAFADSFRVSYSLRGSGHKITVQAESTQEARNTVQALIPGAVVTGAHRVGK